ncbi:MAG: 2-amino-4-hydroxy-6-hydroxymethyldihydropteridine diphosphokinase [Muribaculaceae bacterium]|nr:2-amino-4-hydroxy-6-hydroxymethyldihydropteridine diphosphokinase [Muribaculaceae bacterium]
MFQVDFNKFKDSDNVIASTTKDVEAIFSIGSNWGNRHASVSEGLKWLSNVLSDFRCSSIYATPDCHGGIKEYLNAVVYGKTSLSKKELEILCKKYEAECGRDEEMRDAGKVPVDIDLVIYDGDILRHNDYKREFFKIGYAMI